MTTDIEHVSVRVKNMTIIFYPVWQTVHVLFDGGFPPVQMTMAQFRDEIRAIRKQREI